MKLSLTRQWLDEDGMSVYFAFERGDGYSAVQDVYLAPRSLAEFARRLQSFPSTSADEVTFEAGALDQDGYSSVRLRAFVYDGSGHTALQFRAWGNPSHHLRASIDVCVGVEAASLNRLGESLVAWTSVNDQPLEFHASSS